MNENFNALSKFQHLSFYHLHQFFGVIKVRLFENLHINDRVNPWVDFGELEAQVFLALNISIYSA